MELHQLETFEAVALHGSFTRAAEALHLTQPTVTRQIASLERELRTRLFDRLGRTVRVTASGKILQQYAGQMLRLAREAGEAVADTVSGGTGRIILGASSTLATYVLPSLLRRFRETHARIEIAITTGISAHIVEEVRRGEADIGLVTGGEPDAAPFDNSLTVLPLADYATCVVVPPSHPLAGRRTIRADELAGNPLILMEAGTNLRTYVDRLLSAAGVQEQVAMELDNVEAIKRMIEADLGISLLPQVAVSAEVATGRLVALSLADVPRAHRRVVLVHHRDKYLPAALQAFIALLKAETTSPENTGEKTQQQS